MKTIHIAAIVLFAFLVASCSPKTKKEISSDNTDAAVWTKSPTKMNPEEIKKRYPYPTNAIPGTDANTMFTRVFKIKTNFVANLNKAIEIKKGETTSSAFKRFLEAKGLELKPASAVFIQEEKEKLFVRTTFDDLEKVQKILEEME